MRRNVGGHTDRDAGSTVDEQVRERRWENRRLCSGLIIVGDKVDRVLVHVGHKRRAEMRHARLGVTHGGRRIAFHRSKIALTTNERLAHRPRLSHVDQGGVDYRFTVWMIITARVAADFRALAVLSIWKQRQIVHRVQDSSLRRLESVTRIRQGTRDNNGHGVIEERPRYLLGYIYRFYFFVLIVHGLSPCERR